MSGPLLLALCVLSAVLTIPALQAINNLRGGPSSNKRASLMFPRTTEWVRLIDTQGWQLTGPALNTHDADTCVLGEHQGQAFVLHLEHRQGASEPVAILHMQVAQLAPVPGLEFEAQRARYKVVRRGSLLLLVPQFRSFGGQLGSFLHHLLSTQGDLLGRRLTFSQELLLHVGPEGIALKGFTALSRLPDRVAVCMAIFQAMAQAQLQHWRRCADTFDTTLRYDTGQPYLVVTVQGAVTEARLESRPDGLYTRISAPLHLGFQFSVQRTPRSGPPSVKIHHAIVDSLLHVQTQAPRELLTLLEPTAVIEGVMAICHGYPGSTLSHQSIDLLSPGDLGANLTAAVLLVGDLAAALSGDGGR